MQAYRTGMPDFSGEGIAGEEQVLSDAPVVGTRTCSKKLTGLGYCCWPDVICVARSSLASLSIFAHQSVSTFVACEVGAGGLGVDGRITGIGFGFTGEQVDNALHCQAGKIFDKVPFGRQRRRLNS